MNTTFDLHHQHKSGSKTAAQDHSQAIGIASSAHRGDEKVGAVDLLIFTKDRGVGPMRKPKAIGAQAFPMLHRDSIWRKTEVRCLNPGGITPAGLWLISKLTNQFEVAVLLLNLKAQGQQLPIKLRGRPGITHQHRRDRLLIQL